MTSISHLASAAWFNSDSVAWLGLQTLGSDWVRLRSSFFLCCPSVCLSASFCLSAWPLRNSLNSLGLLNQHCMYTQIYLLCDTECVSWELTLAVKIEIKEPLRVCLSQLWRKMGTTQQTDIAELFEIINKCLLQGKSWVLHTLSVLRVGWLIFRIVLSSSNR